MPELSGPWAGKALQDDQYSRLFSDYGTGVLAEPTSPSGVTLNAQADAVVVLPFEAVVRGRYYALDAPRTLQPAAAGSAPRIDRVVVRFDPAVGAAELAIVQGAPSTTAPQVPALTQTLDGRWEMPIARFRVNPAAPTLTALVGDRPLAASAVIPCTSATRPGMNGTTAPRAGQLIVEMDTSRVLLYVGGGTWTEPNARPPRDFRMVRAVPSSLTYTSGGGIALGNFDPVVLATTKTLVVNGFLSVTIDGPGGQWARGAGFLMLDNLNNIISATSEVSGPIGTGGFGGTMAFSGVFPFVAAGSHLLTARIIAAATGPGSFTLSVRSGILTVEVV